MSFSAESTTYTSSGVATWDANGAPPNPLPSGDIVNVNHAGMLFDWPNAVTWQSGSTVNINTGGNISIQSLTIDAGANVNVNAGGTLTTPGHIINNSNNLVIDGAITDSGNFTNNGTITGSGDLNLGAGSALNGTGSINGTDMGDITYSPGDDLDLSQPLPITLLYFDASVIKNCILLEWSTSAEINNDFFTIERSRNQRDWVVVGETAGSGNSIVTITYTYKDKVTAPGRWYYRLKQTDYDGQFEYFEAVEISLDSRFVESVVYYKESIVHLRNWSNSFWKIYDLKGQVMNEGVTDSFDTHQIWVDNLNAGMYLFQINQSAYRIWIR
ncbi:MAG: hypothetical protein ABJF04_10400 [Reichenbachiella sp.]